MYQQCPQIRTPLNTQKFARQLRFCIRASLGGKRKLAAPADSKPVPGSGWCLWIPPSVRTQRGEVPQPGVRFLPGHAKSLRRHAPSVGVSAVIATTDSSSVHPRRRHRHGMPGGHRRWCQPRAGHRSTAGWQAGRQPSPHRSQRHSDPRLRETDAHFQIWWEIIYMACHPGQRHPDPHWGGLPPTLWPPRQRSGQHAHPAG